MLYPLLKLSGIILLPSKNNDHFPNLPQTTGSSIQSLYDFTKKKGKIAI